MIVLLVDDDMLPTQYYIRALQLEGFTVEHCLGPDSALAFLAVNRDTIVAFVLDVMMPPGKEYASESTHQGLRTGVFLYRTISQRCPNVPVVILTNVTNPATLAEFKEGALLKIAKKLDYPPFELAELVRGMVDEQRKPVP